MIDRLSIILGPPFEPAAPLQPVASSSKSRPAVPRSSSTETLTNSDEAQDSGALKGYAYLNVGQNVLDTLQATAQKALDERVIAPYSITVRMLMYN